MSRQLDLSARKLSYIKYCVAMLCLALPHLGHTHALGMSLLQLSEQSEYQYTVNWKPATVLNRQERPVEIRYPSNCKYFPPLLDCSAIKKSNENSTTIVFDQLPPHAQVVIQLRLLNATTKTYVLPENDNTVDIQFSNDAFSNNHALSIVDSIAIGVEHILLGIDHLLFVFAMILLAGFTRQLIWAISAFTIAHSITLALSALGQISLAPAPVETLIALSIVLVAWEICRKDTSLVKRMPHLTSFVFGLVHGLGFSGALKELGFGADSQWQMLLYFNIGVELGQLMFIAVSYSIWKVTNQLRATIPYRQLNYVATYSLGSIAFYWACDRFAAIVV